MPPLWPAPTARPPSRRCWRSCARRPTSFASTRRFAWRSGPPRLLAWEWSVESYSFELEPDGEGCRLVFTHVFNADFGPPWQHAAGWETYFNRLEAHLDGGYLSEQNAHAGMETLMERYRAEFELA